MELINEIAQWLIILFLFTAARRNKKNVEPWARQVHSRLMRLENRDRRR